MEIYDLFAMVVHAVLFCGVIYSGFLAYGPPEERRVRPSWQDGAMMITLMALAYGLTSFDYYKIRWQAASLVLIAFHLGRWRGAREERRCDILAAESSDRTS